MVALLRDKLDAFRNAAFRFQLAKTQQRFGQMIGREETFAMPTSDGFLGAFPLAPKLGYVMQMMLDGGIHDFLRVQVKILPMVLTLIN